jgi:hypothetical protein
MTYHLWHNGTDTGPYTHGEIAKRHARGELIGVLWRRTGDATYCPHTELSEELDPASEDRHQSASEPPDRHIEYNGRRGSSSPEPSGVSLFGELASGGGGCIAGVGILALIVNPTLAASMVGGGLALVAIGSLASMNAKLALIAHRLRR